MATDSTPYPAAGPQPPRLLDQVRAVLRQRQLAPDVQQAYVRWIVSYLHFHQLRHPRDLGADAVAAFLTSLARAPRTSTEALEQARAALTLLYRDLLHI